MKQIKINLLDFILLLICWIGVCTCISFITINTICIKKEIQMKDKIIAAEFDRKMALYKTNPTQYYLDQYLKEVKRFKVTHTISNIDTIRNSKFVTISTFDSTGVLIYKHIDRLPMTVEAKVGYNILYLNGF